MSLFLASVTLMSVSLSQNIHAQDLLDETDDLLQDGSAVQLDDINIEGKLSPSEQLRKRREKLEDRNKLMVEKKIEDIRVKQEIALTNKLNSAFTKGLNNLNEDKVEVKQAAPVAPVVAPQPIIQPVIVETRFEPKEVLKVERNSKALISLGGQSIKGVDGLDLETNLNFGLMLETKLASNITLGLGASYTTLAATDTAGTYSTSTSICTTGTCSAREMSYSKLSLGANGKFYFTVDSKIRPYLGAGVDLNRTNLKYDQSATYYYSGVTLGNEGLSSNFFSGNVRLGTEVEISDMMGLNLDLSYAKALSSGIAKNADVSSTYNPDQAKLESVSTAIEKADVTSISAGVVIKF
jgi:outer membrane protein W